MLLSETTARIKNNRHNSNNETPSPVAMETRAGDRTVGSATRSLPQIRWVAEGSVNVASEAIAIERVAGTTTPVDVEIT
jgi:hypothetical protein